MTLYPGWPGLTQQSLWLAPWPISILVLSIIAGWFLQPLQSTHMTCHFNHATNYTTIVPVQPLVHCTPLTQTSHGLAIFQYSVPSYNFLGSPLIITLVLLWLPYVIGQTIIFLPCDFFLSIFFFFSSPNLSGRRLDVYHTSAHGVP